ncbi:MAG: tetratricopeptide repeat protein [Lysobacteraceae bacterium]|nr:MAG: tetratricopeptide repeat protein [Xanthomonadaceae bacterium]
MEPDTRRPAADREKALQRACLMQPDSFSSRYEEASHLLGASQPQEALRVLAGLLEEFPGNGDAWNLAGVICTMAGNRPTAVDYLKRAVANGAGAGAWVNLGFAHQKMSEYALAESAYKQAIRADPALPIAWHKLGGLLELQGRAEHAADCYGRAIQLGLDDAKILGDALSLRRALADWDTARPPGVGQLLTSFASPRKIDFAPLLLLALPEADAACEKAAASRFARSQWGALLAQDAMASKPDAMPTRRLRIGYLSSDFREHALSFLVLETIAAHARDTVEVFVYAHGGSTEDRWRKGVIEAAEHFRDIEHLTDQLAAETIAADGIDVLVSFNGYTGNGRMGINALRPAPVLVSWLGYMGTLGEPALADYLIGDAVATPPQLAAHFSEAFALMPHCYQPNGRLEPVRMTPSRSSQKLPGDAIVFCSFNQMFKIHPVLLDDWCEILRRVPHSVLWLAEPTYEKAKQNLWREASNRGVEASRIVFATKEIRDAHLDRVPLADIALDTHPYNSGTTGSDMLRMGVPMLTLIGETLAGRMAASLLTSVGLTDCISHTRQRYVELAVALGNDRIERESLRARLRKNLPTSPLFKPDAFARDLERLYAQMMRNCVAGTRESICLEN